MIPISKLRKVMRQIAANKGDFSLFGLFRRANAPGTWDLVVAAPWLKPGDVEPLRELTQLLSKEIGKQSLVLLSRVVVLNQRDPNLDAVISAYSVDDGEIRLQHSTLFGQDIEDAIIMRAKKAA